MARTPRYQAESGGSPLWASEPFRVFFPLGIAAGIFGLLLWPLHYLGWWPSYPAIQHPRILIFGFGAAFLFGFLGTAWPRFLEAKVLSAYEVAVLLFTWCVSQLYYVKGDMPHGDLASAIACLWLLIILGVRMIRKERELPPPGFTLAFSSVALTTATLFCWVAGWDKHSPEWYHIFRLIAYQGFLLLPLIGVGSYLFARFFQVPGEKPAMVSAKKRGVAVWLAAGIILVSFAVEAFLSPRYGNLLRLGGFVVWAVGAVPGIWMVRAAGTRPWALRLGLILIAVGFLCRTIWPLQLFAFEHLLFLCGFGLVIMLTADRVIMGHCASPAEVKPKSKTWRWIAWLTFIAAATRATADLVPSTRVSHHIYAAIMVSVVFLIWFVMHAKRFSREAPSE